MLPATRQGAQVQLYWGSEKLDLQSVSNRNCYQERTGKHKSNSIWGEREVGPVAAFSMENDFRSAPGDKSPSLFGGSEKLES